MFVKFFGRVFAKYFLKNLWSFPKTSRLYFILLHKNIYILVFCQDNNVKKCKERFEVFDSPNHLTRWTARALEQWCVQSLKFLLNPRIVPSYTVPYTVCIYWSVLNIHYIWENLTKYSDPNLRSSHNFIYMDHLIPLHSNILKCF